MTERIEIPCDEYDHLRVVYNIRPNDDQDDHGTWPGEGCSNGCIWSDHLPNGARLCGKSDALDGCRHWIEAT